MDPFNLDRFVRAQHNVYARALEEVRQGQKRSHWMWFIFPQFKGLGSSETSIHYAINSLEEARAYLDHPVLGPRLIEISSALMNLKNKSAAEIFGYPDDLKLHSSLSLFAAASEGENIFDKALETFFNGQPDPKTLNLLRT
ncbi:MAG TPA: DUF1810 domain-containing protein [Chitinophagaceae bacterium]|nr:DUF1810 domain-containing protein [Chitinophagaceae bacterium]